jgi:hypothetical protein
MSAAPAHLQGEVSGVVLRHTEEGLQLPRLDAQGHLRRKEMVGDTARHALPTATAGSETQPANSLLCNLATLAYPNLHTTRVHRFVHPCFVASPMCRCGGEGGVAVR